MYLGAKLGVKLIRYWLVFFLFANIHKVSARGELVTFDCGEFDHGQMVIDLSNKTIQFLGTLTPFTLDHEYPANIYATSVDDQTETQLWLVGYDPYVEEPARMMSFTWSQNIFDSSGDIAGNHYTEGSCRPLYRP